MSDRYKIGTGFIHVNSLIQHNRDNYVYGRPYEERMGGGDEIKTTQEKVT